MYYDSTCTIGTVDNTPTGNGMKSEALTWGDAIPCFITAESGTRNLNGREGTEYTHLLYIPWQAVSGSSRITHDSSVYDIVSVLQAPREHHTELALKIRGD